MPLAMLILKSLSSYLQNFFTPPFVPQSKLFQLCAKCARGARALHRVSKKRTPSLATPFLPLKPTETYNPKQSMTWARSMVRGTNETSSIFRLLFLPSSFPRPSSPEWKLCQSLSVLPLMSGEGAKKKDSNTRKKPRSLESSLPYQFSPSLVRHSPGGREKRPR